MPPRLLLTRLSCALQPVSVLPPSFLLPFLQHHRAASILASISDTKGAYNKRIRRGRGPSSGKGKTSGRGHKGQGQHGKVPAHFAGGQTPDIIVHGKHGFKNIHAEQMSLINLDQIQDWINQSRLDPSQPITVKELAASRAVHGVKDGIKLLARGASALTAPINLVVSRASSAAIAAVEALGGTVTTRFYTRYAIKRIRQGKTAPYVSMKWDPEAMGNAALLEDAQRIGLGSDPAQRVKGLGFQYRLPDPTSRKDLEYYRDPAKRGYLAHTVKENETPSLYHKKPATEWESAERDRKQQEAKKAAEVAVNRLW